MTARAVYNHTRNFLLVCGRCIIHTYRSIQAREALELEDDLSPKRTYLAQSILCGCLATDFSQVNGTCWASCCCLSAILRFFAARILSLSAKILASASLAALILACNGKTPWMRGLILFNLNATILLWFKRNYAQYARLHKKVRKWGWMYDCRTKSGLQAWICTRSSLNIGMHQANWQVWWYCSTLIDFVSLSQVYHKAQTLKR